MKRSVTLLLTILLFSTQAFAYENDAHDVVTHVFGEDAAFAVDGTITSDNEVVGRLWSSGDGAYAVSIYNSNNRALSSTVLPIPPMHQDGFYDCWATCGAMIVNYKTGARIYPADFVCTAYGDETSGDRPGSWSLMKAGCSSYGLSVTQVGVMSTAQVQAQINRRAPLIMVGKTARGNNHDVVLKGYDEIGYWYNDPWTGQMQFNTYGAKFLMSMEWVTWERTYWGFDPLM